MTNEEAIHILTHLERYAAEEDGYFMIYPPLMDATLLAIKALRAQEHGHWIIEDNFAVCSVCGHKTAGTNIFICDGEKWIPCFSNNHCDNCGAKMTKEN